MTIMTKSLELKSLNWQPNYYEEVMQNVQTLLSTIQGTIPYGRKIGIDGDLQDKPINEVKGLMMSEVVHVLKRYEPRAKVKTVNVYYEEGEVRMELDIDVEELT